MTRPAARRRTAVVGGVGGIAVRGYRRVARRHPWGAYRAHHTRASLAVMRSFTRIWMVVATLLLVLAFGQVRDVPSAAAAAPGKAETAKKKKTSKKKKAKKKR